MDLIALGDVVACERQAVGGHDPRRSGQERRAAGTYGWAGIRGYRVVGEERMEAFVGMERVAGAEGPQLVVHHAPGLEAQQTPGGADHAHPPRWTPFGVSHAHG